MTVSIRNSLFRATPVWTAPAVPQSAAPAVPRVIAPVPRPLYTVTMAPLETLFTRDTAALAGDRVADDQVAVAAEGTNWHVDLRTLAMCLAFLVIVTIGLAVVLASMIHSTLAAVTSFS